VEILHRRRVVQVLDEWGLVKVALRRRPIRTLLRGRVVDVVRGRLVDVTLRWLRHIVLLRRRLVNASNRRRLVEVFLGGRIASD